jgi:hypothetical protein
MVGVGSASLEKPEFTSHIITEMYFTLSGLIPITNSAICHKFKPTHHRSLTPPATYPQHVCTTYCAGGCNDKCPNGRCLFLGGRFLHTEPLQFETVASPNSKVSRVSTQFRQGNCTKSDVSLDKGRVVTLISCSLRRIREVLSTDR